MHDYLITDEFIKKILIAIKQARKDPDIKTREDYLSIKILLEILEEYKLNQRQESRLNPLISWLKNQSNSNIENINIKLLLVEYRKTSDVLGIALLEQVSTLTFLDFLHFPNAIYWFITDKIKGEDQVNLHSLISEDCDRLDDSLYKFLAEPDSMTAMAGEKTIPLQRVVELDAPKSPTQTDNKSIQPQLLAPVTETQTLSQTVISDEKSTPLQSISSEPSKSGLFSNCFRRLINKPSFGYFTTPMFCLFQNIFTTSRQTSIIASKQDVHSRKECAS